MTGAILITSGRVPTIEQIRGRVRGTVRLLVWGLRAGRPALRSSPTDARDSDRATSTGRWYRDRGRERPRGCARGPCSWNGPDGRMGTSVMAATVGREIASSDWA